MNPNMTAWNQKITTLIGPCGISSAMTGVHWLRSNLLVSFIWKQNVYLMARNNHMNLFRWDGESWFSLLEEERGQWERERGRGKSTVRMRGVIEHNGNTGPHSAGGTLAETKPPILRWQAANGGPLPHGMLMPNSGPRGLAPAPWTQGKETCQGACMTASIHTHKWKR